MALRQAVAAEPNYFESLLNLGAYLASLGESKDAVRFLRQAIQARPNHVNARLNLAKALLSQNDMAAARQ